MTKKAKKWLYALLALIGIIFSCQFLYSYYENSYVTYVGCAKFESINKCKIPINITSQRKYISTGSDGFDGEYHQRRTIAVSDEYKDSLNLYSRYIEIEFGHENQFNHSYGVYMSPESINTVFVNKLIGKNLLLGSEMKSDNGAITIQEFIIPIEGKNMFATCAPPYISHSGRYSDETGCGVSYEIKNGVWIRYIVDRKLFISDWELMNKKVLDYLNKVTNNSLI